MTYGLAITVVTGLIDRAVVRQGQTVIDVADTQDAVPFIQRQLTAVLGRVAGMLARVPAVPAARVGEIQSRFGHALIWLLHARCDDSRIGHIE
jgi:Mg/Co/Ni transporter MgtE